MLLDKEKLNPFSQDAISNTSRYNLPSGLILERITNKKTSKSSILKELVK